MCLILIPVCLLFELVQTEIVTDALEFGGKRQKANCEFGGKRQKARKYLVERHKCIIFV